MRGTVTALALLAALFPATAGAQSGGTAPAYPGNTLTVEATAPVVAGTVMTVRLSGHAEWGEPTDETTIPFDLALYAQDADVHPTCEVSKGDQRSKSINLSGLNASAGISGFVMDGDIKVNPGPPNPGVDWATDSVPFAIRPGVRNVVFCAYQNYVIDDVAWYGLPVRVDQPSCRLREAAVRRGRRLRLACNVKGRFTLRFARRGGGARTVAVTVGDAGTARVPTARLRPGRYRVTMVVGELGLGVDRVRIR